MAVTDINTAIQNIEAQINAETLSPKPSYNIDGKEVDWNTWLKYQMDTLERLTVRLNQYQPYIGRVRYRM